jgi:hypothetical protein
MITFDIVGPNRYNECPGLKYPRHADSHWIIRCDGCKEIGPYDFETDDCAMRWLETTTEELADYLRGYGLPDLPDYQDFRWSDSEYIRGYRSIEPAERFYQRMLSGKLLCVKCLERKVSEPW